ncbi:hypothetical protein [Actinomycetospora atypica]|uniref:Uncharacterized protein n=1 Tax=Actinomycetospora atypica TaxID=1290095 RepID=A0ABV9YI30_9PSEU
MGQDTGMQQDTAEPVTERLPSLPSATRRRPLVLALVALVLLATGAAGGWLVRGATTRPAAAPAPVTVTVQPTPLAAPPIVPAPTTRATGVPVLGTARPDSRGYGSPRPSVIDGGASSSGLVEGVRWSDWGEDRARGRGTALYVPEGSANAEGRRERAEVVAFDLGECDGRRAYRRVAWYFPQHDEAFDPARSLPVCS